jgi:hypothetical protein
VDGEVADVLAARTFPVDGPPPVIFSEVRHIGGAVARGDRAASSFGGRDHEFLFNTIGVAPTPEAAEALAAHHAGTREALASHLAERVYPNFVEGAERVARPPPPSTRDRTHGSGPSRPRSTRATCCASASTSRSGQVTSPGHGPDVAATLARCASVPTPGPSTR